MKQRRIVWNPVVGVELPAVEETEAKRWSPAEAAKFISATAGDELGLLYRVAVLRGARRGELAGLRWADADLNAGVIAVTHTILQLGGKLVTGGKPKTRAGERLIFLDRETAGLLREHHRTQLRARMKAGPAWQDNGLIFCQADGRPWHPDHLSRRFKRLAGQAGVPAIKLHEARHSAISLMRDAGVGKEIRMREAGHSDNQVADRYVHVLRVAHLEAAEQVAALVRKARSGA